jgi:serine/threonine protein kinase/WD40 repeat protein
MLRRPEPNLTEYDERLGEAVDEYLALAETGPPPDPSEFVSKYPDLAEDLRAALDGLSLVRGLVSGPGDPGQRLEAGRRIAGYKIVRELGRGGMGVVYEAVHVDLDRPVALKILGAHAAPDSNGRRRFLNEARTAAGLHHTHIVPVFDVGQVGGLCYYAMQRIEGSGLDRVVRRLRKERANAAGLSADWQKPSQSVASARGPGEEETVSWSAGDAGLPHRSLEKDSARDDEPPFEPARGPAYYRWVANVGRQAAEALAHAHGRGVIHRDVKPSNLLVDARGMIWVADFGLSRRLADPELTQSDNRLGTPRYMSPEQTRIGPVDSRSDVYSLGATLYELLTLKPPFDGRSAVELAQQILDREPAAPRKFDPKIPRDLETIVLKAMAKRPSDRYETAQELAEDLSRFLAFEPVRARRISPAGRLWRFSRRHPQLAVVSTVAVLAIISVVSVAYIRVSRERDRAVAAERRKEEALVKEKAARREGLAREVELIVHSFAPHRRERGFPRLKEAASLDPAPELKAKLRDEAVALFAVRDVEARPAIKTEPSRSVLFGLQGARLATLSEDGREFSLWDTSTLKRVNRQTLTPPAQGGEAAVPGGANGIPRQRPPRLLGDPRVGLASPSLFIVVPPDNRGIRLFDAVTGASERNNALAGRTILYLFTSPAASRLVTVEVSDSSQSRTRTPEVGEAKRQRPSPSFVVNVWNTEALDQPVQLQMGEVSAPPIVALSPDGELVASAIPGQSGISVWSAADGILKRQITTQTPSSALALGPEGLLAEAGDGLIRLWQVSPEADAAPLPSLNTHQGTILRMRFSPDGTMLATSSGRAPGFANSLRAPSVELWDLVTDPQSPYSVILRAPDEISDLAFSANGRMLAASAVNSQRATGSVSVWEIIEPIGRVRLPEFKSIAALSFNNEGELAVASREESLRLWHAGECPTIPRVLSGVLASAASFDAQGRLETLETSDGRILNRYPRLERQGPPEGDSRVGKILTATPTESVELPHLQDRRPRNPARPPGGPPMGFGFGFVSMTRSRGGQTLVLTRGSEIFIRRGSDPELLRLVIPPVGARGGPVVRSLAVSPLGDRLYGCVAGPDSMRAWSLGPGQASVARGESAPVVIAAPLPWSFPKDVVTLALSPDGRRLALGQVSGAISMMDTETGTVVANLPAPIDYEGDNRISSLAFAPQGNELAVGMNDRVRLWALGEAPKPIVWLPGHRGLIRHIAYGPRGEQLATAGEDHIVQIWDLKKVHSELDKLGLDW